MPLLDSEKKLMAQETEMSVTIYEVPLLTIGGVVLSPLQSMVYGFSPFTASSFFFPSGSYVGVFFSDQTTSVPINFYISSYAKDDIVSFLPLPSDLEVIGDVFYDFRAFWGLIEVESFDGDFVTEFHYDDSEATGFKEGTFKVYFWDISQESWIPIEDFTLNQANNIITFTRDHLTLFGIFGEPGEEAPPVVVTGGGGGTITLPPVSAPSKAQRADIDKNGKVDILDFNTLMVHWGETNKGNLVDINDDNIVDILDFDLLMIHWSH